MVVQVSYPGVYIQELPAAGPIQGVGTSTAAFLGPARHGTPNRPALVTSFDEFRSRFGDRPLTGFYLWSAVRGFFENGGQWAYIVRVSNGAYAETELPDSRPVDESQPALVVRSRQLGATEISVTVAYSAYVETTVFRPEPALIETAVVNAQEITLAADEDADLTDRQVAAQFRAGDRVLVENIASETATIRRVQGNTLVIDHPLTDEYSGGTIRLDDLRTGDQELRVDSTEDGRTLGPGSVINLQQDGVGAETAVVASVQVERIRPGLTTYRLTLETALTGGPYDLGPGDDIEVASEEFNLSVNQGAEVREHLSMARNNPRYFGSILAAEPFGLIVVEEPDAPSTATLDELHPPEDDWDLDPGDPDVPAELTASEYQDALDALREEDAVNFIAMPDSTRLAADQREIAQLALLTHCTDMGDRFAIFDPPPEATRETIGNVVNLLRSERGFGALYFPWILVSHPAGGTYLMPPSGHVAGIYARADAEQGVHKAPANYILNGALGAAHKLNDEQQGVLNLDGINVLRVFPNSRRPVVWGARTTSNDTAWQYVNIRRLMLFIEESLQEGLRWAVFEPNNLQLWQKVRRSVTHFLTNVWRSGALFGATAEEAFYVRVDETNNPESERQLGRLHIEIGVRPAYPAEFIIVRIGLWADDAELTET